MKMTSYGKVHADNSKYRDIVIYLQYFECSGSSLCIIRVMCSESVKGVSAGPSQKDEFKWDRQDLR